MKKMMALVCLFALILSGCTPSKESQEGRIQRLLTGLSSEASSRASAVYDVLHDLSLDDQVLLLDAIPFDALEGQEGEWIDVLNVVVPDWRNLEGFTLTYLKQSDAMLDPAIEVEDQQSLILVDLTTATTLEDVLKNTVLQVVLKGHHELDDLYLYEDRLLVTWVFESGAMRVISANFQVVDLVEGHTYGVTLDQGTLQIKKLDKSEVDMGALKMTQAYRMSLETDVFNLVPFELEVPVTLSYTGPKADMTPDEEITDYAMVTEIGFVPVDETEGLTNHGTVQLAWTNNALELRKTYRILK